MDILTFLALLSFQLTILGILAIVYSQNQLVKEVISSLTGMVGSLFQKGQQQNRSEQEEAEAAQENGRDV